MGRSVSTGTPRDQGRHSMQKGCTGEGLEVPDGAILEPILQLVPCYPNSKELSSPVCCVKVFGFMMQGS